MQRPPCAYRCKRTMRICQIQWPRTYGRFRSLTKPINKLWELGSSYHRAFMLLETRARASRYGDWALVSGKKSVIETWSLERSSKQLAAAARELGRPENASSGTAYMCAPIWSPPGILYSGKVKLFISGSLTVFAGGSRAAAAWSIYIGNWPRRHRWTAGRSARTSQWRRGRGEKRQRARRSTMNRAGMYRAGGLPSGTLVR
jgi:hypothetical protein